MIDRDDNEYYGLKPYHYYKNSKIVYYISYKRPLYKSENITYVIRIKTNLKLNLIDF